MPKAKTSKSRGELLPSGARRTASSFAKNLREFKQRHDPDGKTPTSLREDPDLFTDIVYLLQTYNDSQKLQGRIMKDIVTGMSNRNNVCYWIVFDDDTREDFSFIECTKQLVNRKDGFDNRRDRKLKKFKNACRYEVIDQIESFRIQQKAAAGMHVDHTNPCFDDILHDFCIKENVNEIPRTNSLAGGVCKLRDRELAMKWSAYHLINAKLKLVTVQENLSKACKQGRNDWLFMKTPNKLANK